MAYAAVTSLMSTLGLLLQSNSRLNLPNTGLTESLHRKVKEQIQSLRQKVGSLQALLETLEKNINDPKTIEHCEVKITDAAHDAEYRIESVLEKIYKAQNKKVQREAYKELYKRLQQASKSIDSNCRNLTESMNSTGLQMQASNSLVQRIDLPEHSVQLDDNNMVGHENELEDMKSTLMETSSDERETMAITGMGGIGKTTFARRIYDDVEIKSHFDILAWVTMSKEYCVRKMLLQLLHCIQSTEDASHEATDDGELAGKLKQKLWKRRYLVVIDDIWSTNAWDDISQWFPDSKGSHVLLTTRSGNVASYAASGKPPHHMSPLSSKQSWELLQSKVELSPELVKIGKKIAENCHGVPLAVTVVAGLLSKCNNALDRWEQVAEDVKSAIFEDPGQQCEKVLALSYYYLPQHLKGCFLYFGIFSEDDEINVTTLINLWVAEGILKEVGNKSLEDVAEEYLQELIDRNLVLVGQQNFCGDVETCRIHDLLHELCLRQARSENFLPVIDDKPPYRASRVPQSFMQVCVMIVRSIGGFHRLNSHCYDQNSHCYDQKVIRTIIYQGEHDYYVPHNKYLLVVDNERGMREISEFENSKMIRVLALRKLYFDNDIPASLFDLVHLRYLSLTIDSPELLSLLKLQRLQVLIVEILNFARNKIPLQIWRMPRLRSVHFITTRWQCPPKMANAEGKQVVLEHLHTLSGVGPAWCKKEIFALMPNLNKLEIVLDRSVDPRDSWIAISYLPLVETLRIKDNDLSPNSPPHMDVFSAHRSTLPPTLRRLTLCGSHLPWESMDIVGMLPKLEALELEDNAFGEYYATTWKPTRVFSQLKFLSLRKMGFFIEWKATEDHFPVLERLFISHCLRLKEIPQEFANVFTLQLINLHDCCIHLAISAQQIQQEQEATFGAQVTNVHTYSCGQAYCSECHHLPKRNSRTEEDSCNDISSHFV